MKENNIKVLTDIEHVLKRTGMYVGCINHTKQNMFILNNSDEMEYKEINYVPALIKIMREIIDNSCDEYIRTNGKFATTIKISCTNDGWISVEDDGRGIPVSKLENGMLAPDAAWTELRAGSNFDDAADNVTLGQNGIGASVVNVTSKEFIGETSDGKNKFRMVCKDNLSDKTITVTPCKKQYTEVKFLPDYPRFDLPNGIDETHINILKTDVANIAMCYPGITFYFNNKRVNGKQFEKYVQQFKAAYEIYEVNNVSLAVLTNNLDDFNFVHYVNGANTYEGGNPFNYIMDTTYEAIKDRIAALKKLKTLKKGDVRNKTTFIAFIRNLPNPRFDSQIKSKCINQATEVKPFIDDEQLDKFIKRIARNEAIVNPIVELLELKENAKHLRELSNIEGQKKIKCDKYLPPIGAKKYLVLAEGDSAIGGISSALGRSGLGYFAMRGVPRNTWNLSIKEVIQNKEMENIIKILGLRLSDKDSKDCTFENILIASDADSDGSHICGVILAFFLKYCKWMFTDGKIKRLRTPVILLKHKDKVIKFFFNLNEYNDYIKKHDVSKYDLKYVKGLGGFNKAEMRQIIEENGFDHFVQTYEYDESQFKIVDDWVSESTSDNRKEMLRNNNFNIFGM